MTSHKPLPSQPFLDKQTAQVLYIIACTGIVVLDLFPDQKVLRMLFKGAMMPLLAVWVNSRFEGRAPQIITISLVFATLGDIFLDLEGILGKGPWFQLGMLFFLCMQATYLIGFYRMPEHNHGVPLPAMLIYGAVIVVFNYAIGPKLGELQIPTLVYSVFLVGMATFSSAFTTKMMIGGGMFAVSDFLIVVGMVGGNFPLRSFLVQITYVVAQYLLINDWGRLSVGEIKEKRFSASSKSK